MKQGNGVAASLKSFRRLATARTFLSAAGSVTDRAETLEANFWTKGNRPSFGLMHGEDREPPGLAILAGYDTKGYAAKYSSLFEAERQHGKLIISPLGNLFQGEARWLGEAPHHTGLAQWGANLLAAMFERIVCLVPPTMVGASTASGRSWRKGNCHRTAASGVL